MSDLAIIGAGICGLRCAEVLQSAGITVELFDKGRGVGGRLATRRHEHWRFDHGAPSLHGDTAQWWARIHAYPSWTCDDNARHHKLPEFGVNQLAKDLAEPLNIQRGCQIESIARRTRGWYLVDQHGSEHGPYAKLVITAPCPQTQALIKSLDTPIIEALADVHMTPAWVMMLVTTLPIITTQELRPSHDVVRRISAEHSKPGRALGPEEHSYVVEAAVAWSQKHEEDTPTDVQTTLMASLQDIATEMGQLLHSAVHRWRYAHTGSALGQPYLFDSDLSLAVAGDWCLGIGAEGAYLSGEGLAKMLLESADI
jgi:renalase